LTRLYIYRSVVSVYCDVFQGYRTPRRACRQWPSAAYHGSPAISLVHASQNLTRALDWWEDGFWHQTLVVYQLRPCGRCGPINRR